jgi:lipoprotein-anchoring transpeptidase ErfK/SrfK
MSDQVLRPADPSGDLPTQAETGTGTETVTEPMTTSQAPRTPSHGDPGRSRAAGRTAGAGKGSPGPRHPQAQAGSSVVASVLGFAAAAALGGLVWSSGCRNEPPPGASTDVPSRVSSLPVPPTPTATASVADAKSAAPSPSAAPSAAPYTGPLLGALGLQTAVYPTPEYQPHKILGYIRLGGKVPVEATPPLKNSSCAKGWYHLVDGGYVCGRYSTIDIGNPQVRLGITPPNLEDVLPYKYAYNTAHGTPLYRSVPSKEEMIKYEPYLAAAKRAARHKADDDDGDTTPADTTPAPAPAASDDPGDKDKALATAASVGILGGPVLADDPPPPPKPWWQQVSEPGKPLTVKLSDLDQDSDSTIAKRMVKGFFVAVDKTFGWNNRSWYKTTGGLVAPADRMYIVKPPTTQGMDFPEGVTQIGFITASKAAKYDFDADRKKVSVLGPVARFTPVGLTGATVSNKTIIYRQTTEGWWMKAIDGTTTEPGPPPPDLAPGEKWIDVNLTRKTMVALEGDKPIYAALISPGKKSKIKEKDHSTVQGTFRIREKHIAVTMDGDGATVSDLPYSIEDVPYVQYFEGSYALHGAFWHNNFGHEMSHGCVNLSPLDAKRVFFWSEPKLPRGWHAVWSTPDNRGTLVVVHE